MISSYKILIKFPSRGRVDRFFASLQSIYNNIYDHQNYHISCTLDTDDASVNNAEVISRIEALPNISISWGLSESKVHAINRDMPLREWDILILMSDDISFTFYGFDQMIRNSFLSGLDSMKHFPDNDEKDKLPILYIAGKDFYTRFNHIYDPVYLSLFCDTEIMAVAQELGVYEFINCPGLFFHALPAYGHQPADEMWLTQQKIGWTIDQKTYLERRAKRLGLPINTAILDWFDAYKNDAL